MQAFESTDQELVQRAKAGDNTAFGELWGRHEARVVALCRRHLAGPHRDPAVDEHDLATEAFIRALHRLDRYTDRTAEGIGFEAWLLEVARHICLTFLAKQQRRRRWSALLMEDHELAERPDSAPTPEQVVMERQVLRLTALAINHLPDLYRVPFKLFLEERSHKGIAEALGISVESAAKRVQRARRLLQPRLAPLLQPPRKAEAGPPRASLRAVERALTEIVSDFRIVAITLPTGGEMQLCLRVDREMADRAPEIEARRARLQRYPRAWKKRLELAELCYHGGAWEAAQREYREALRINPRCFAAALRLGQMLCLEDQRAEAAQLYRAALGQEPPPAEAARLQAQLLAAEGNDKQAVRAFRRAIDLCPGEKASYRGLDAALGRLSRYEEQLENLARLRQLDPEDLPAHLAVYTPCAQLGRFDLARPLLERAAALDPHHPLAIKLLFQVRMNLGLRDAETLALAERLVKLAPEFVASWAELAWIYAELGRDDESLAVLRHFLQEHPQNAEAHAALAWRYHYLGQTEGEFTHARRAYELEPQNPYIGWTLLTATQNAGVADREAFQYAEAIADRFPADAAVIRAVSALYSVRGREAAAVKYGRRAVALAPASVEAHAHLAGVYRRFQRWEAAVELYEWLVERPGGRSAGLLAAWGHTLKALNDPRAEALLAEASALARSSQDHQALAHAYEGCGEREAAIASYRRSLSPSSVPPHLRRSVEAALQRLGASSPERRRRNTSAV
jgi:RNA polymerase sigma factor (sigma-70 family)